MNKLPIYGVSHLYCSFYCFLILRHYPGSFIQTAALNNYLFALNRHPGKRVDLEISPSDIPGEVGVDFLVSQQCPHHFYVNANNNVPDVIHRWQESFGYINTQVTGRDDILWLDYSTDSFDSLYSASISYDAPLGRTLGNRWKIAFLDCRFTSVELVFPIICLKEIKIL